MSTNDTAQVEPAATEQGADAHQLEGKSLEEIVAGALFTAARGCTQATVRRLARQQAIKLMAA